MVRVVVRNVSADDVFAGRRADEVMQRFAEQPRRSGIDDDRTVRGVDEGRVDNRAAVFRREELAFAVDNPGCLPDRRGFQIVCQGGEQAARAERQHRDHTGNQKAAA